MNTPAHVILNAVVLNRKARQGLWLPVMLGALLPDLPMFLFYLYQKMAGQPEMTIWKELYFDPRWQTFFDIPNALPVIVPGILLGWWLKKPFLLLTCLSMALHVLSDLPLHHDDAHRHFWPLSQWRFASPVSYWDPQHHGLVSASVEMIAGVTGAIYLGLKTRQRGLRRVGICWGLIYLAYGVFVLVFWVLPNTNA